MRNFFFVFFAFVLSSFASVSSDLDLALKKYNENNFPEAIDLWKSVLERGTKNPEILYNLGNAYYRNNQIGFAIYYYESALLLAPTDKDIQYNLKLAKSKTKDKVENEAEENPILEALFVAHHFFSLNTQLVISAVFLWCISILLFLRIALRKEKNKNICIGVTFILTLFFFVFAFSAAYKIFVEQTKVSGVVVALNTDVLSTPFEKGETLHVLSEGTSFEIVSETEQFAEIALGERIHGFVSKADIGILKGK